METVSLQLGHATGKEGDTMNRKRIKQRRHELDMTAETLGKAVGISRQMVFYIEAGTRTPSIDTITKIANALGLPLSELLKGENDK